MTEDQQRELTEARIDIRELQVQNMNFATALEQLRVVNKEQSAKLDQVLLTLSEAKGGWKTMMLFGTAALSLGGCIAWVFEHLPKG